MERMERHFEIELNGVKERVLWMGSLAERAVHQAIHSVLDSDASLAEAVLEEEPRESSPVKSVMLRLDGV